MGDKVVMLGGEPKRYYGAMVNGSASLVKSNKAAAHFNVEYAEMVLRQLRTIDGRFLHARLEDWKP